MIMKYVHHKLTCLTAGPWQVPVLGEVETFRRWDLAGIGGSPRPRRATDQLHFQAHFCFWVLRDENNTHRSHPSPRDQATASLADLDGLVAPEARSQTTSIFPEVASTTHTFWL